MAGLRLIHPESFCVGAGPPTPAGAVSESPVRISSNNVPVFHGVGDRFNERWGFKGMISFSPHQYLWHPFCWLSLPGGWTASQEDPRF